MKRDRKPRHWTSMKFSETLMMDALLKHLLSLTSLGRADVGEVFEVMAQLQANDEERWINAWSDRAARLQQRAEKAEAAGEQITASSAYLRASTYWRASLMYFSFPDDRRMRDHAAASTNCYERYLALSRYPGRSVKIPYENGFLPGYFYRSPTAEEKGPLLILTPGRDTWAEDTCWIYDAAVRRGIHCLVYDGPGQGFALRLNGLHFRPDWENVIGRVVDYAFRLPEVDTSRVGLMGMSFGAFLSVRAAAFEKRVKLCIADPGCLNWGESITSHFPPPLRQVLRGQGPDFLRQAFTVAAEHTSLDWLVRDYAWKHGVEKEEVFQALAAYDNTAVVDRIKCRMLVIDGTEELAEGQARRLFDALRCPKDYLLFDEGSTAQLHCQMGAYAPASAEIFAWIGRHL